MAFLPPVATPQGDGSFVVRPGKPVSWLTPGQFAATVGQISRESIYRYIQDGSIPSDQVRYAGKRKILIAAGAVEAFLATWRQRRQG